MAKSEARRLDLAPLGGGISGTGSPLSPPRPHQDPIPNPRHQQKQRSGAARSEGDR